MHKLLYEQWRTWLIALLVCIPLLQTLLVPWMPGLDSDKADVGIVAHQIIHGGALSLKGTTPYTGTLRIYLISLSFLIGEYTASHWRSPSRYSTLLRYFLYSSPSGACSVSRRACGPPW